MGNWLRNKIDVMTNVIIIGASGNIAGKVISMLESRKDVLLTLFMRNVHRLRKSPISGIRVVEGDVLKDYGRLKDAVAGQDIVYINLAGDLEAMTKNIVRAMQVTGVRRVIFI